MKKIDPKRLIQDLSVEGLCDTAEKRYANIKDPSYLIARPFSDFFDCPWSLYRLGLLLDGLRLGKSMIVLEFGSGVCWLSRWLNQLQCSTISVDCSISALEIGRELFSDHPIIGEYLTPPRFVHFGGHHIDVESGSVDRIICFDVFHHVPNQKEILNEFYRILKPGGIVGFSEPGINHSQSPESQIEMRDYNVLENDIVLQDIKRMAEEVGFKDIYIKFFGNPYINITYNDHQQIISGSIPGRIIPDLIDSMKDATVFFLTKGDYSPDSRTKTGLKHRINTTENNLDVYAGIPFYIEVHIENTGDARWLHKNINHLGVVRLGIHLYNEDCSKLLEPGFFRSDLKSDISPGEKIMKKIQLILPNPGKYSLALDMVSEQVCWFEKVGSTPKVIHIDVKRGSQPPDSRTKFSLMHRINITKNNYEVNAGAPFGVEVHIENTGEAKWLHDNMNDLGVVRLGAHLYNDDCTKLLDLDFFRSGFESDISPGEKIVKNIQLILPNPGRYTLALDMVSEQVCWFEQVGSEPKLLRVVVH